jgi:hypothetical protein
MLFAMLVNPLTGKDLDWADPSKHPSVPALGKAVINKCFTEYGDEVRAFVCCFRLDVLPRACMLERCADRDRAGQDEVKACVDKYQENRELMDPTLGGIKTLGNTASMYHQPAQNWQVCIFHPPEHMIRDTRIACPACQISQRQRIVFAREDGTAGAGLNNANFV